MTVGYQCTLDNLEEFPFAEVFNAEILNFLFENVSLYTFSFDSCMGSILFKFFSPYSPYDNTFFSQIVYKPIFTAQNIYINKYLTINKHMH